MRNLYKFQLLLLLVALFGKGQAMAQQPNAVPGHTAERTVLAPIQRLGVVDMQQQSEDWDPFFKTVQKIHAPGIDARKDQVMALKAEANRVHDALIAAGVPASTAEKTTTSTAPTLGTNFFGNSYGGGDPADNALAVSEAGLMISGSNTRFHTYDASGTQTSSKSFTQFATAGGVPTSFTFDPKCVYDPNEDRFIVAFINGASSSSSKVVVGFSQTNDPAGLWNVYAINGNVNSLGVWTDFIQLGINNDELFITGNPFTNAGASLGAVVWQISKTEGYTGGTLNPVVHYESGAFSIHPVQGGSTLYGPKMYFLQSELGSSTNVSLYEMTNTIANNGVLNSAVGFTLDVSYGIPPSADQRGTTVNLKTNDTRIQSSYFENGRIEFVLNSAVNSMSGVYHGTGVISPFLLQFSSFTGRLIGYTDLDISYPSIAYAGLQDVSGFNHSYIAFNTTGPNNFPGMAAVYSDETGYSPKVVIKEGVNFINSADQRWGDYADLCERKNHPGEVWAVGTMGNSSQQQRTYIGQLLPPQPVAVTPVVDNGTKMEVFPNPATEIVKFEFPVDEAGEYKVIVRDLEGRMVKLVIQDWLVAGNALLTFNAQHLAAGTYLVSVENDSKQLFTEKLVVNH
jgi:hypothetical protein